MPQSTNPDANSFWRWDGTVSRRTYALVGLIGFAIKHNLDRYIAREYLPRSNGLFNYWEPLGKFARLTALSYPEKLVLFQLLLLALPFIWIGVGMTVRRLRDAGQPVWLVCLFFIPFLNLIFFLILCFLPPKESNPSKEAAPWPNVRPLDAIIPRGKLANALLTTFVTSAIGLVFLLPGPRIMQSYGWSLFVALPFCMGMFAALLYSYHEPRSFQSCMEVALIPIFILGAVIIGIAVEGVICVMMAAPIALALAFLGGTVGFLIQERYWSPRHKPAILSVILLVIPSAFLGEHAVALRPPVYVGSFLGYHQRAARKSLEPGGGLRGNSATARTAVSRRRRLSHSRRNRRIRCRCHAALHFLYRPFRGAHHGLGRTARLEI